MQKVLTSEQMAAVDRATIDRGIPGLILMENAASRVVEFLVERFAPLAGQRILVVCGKGNNGGDGLAIARQLHVRFETLALPAKLRVVLIANPDELTGDAAANLRMLRASGFEEYRDFAPEMRDSTLVVDAVLGTGLRGPASGAALDAIREINASFPFAKVVAVDIPSGLSGDTGDIPGEYVRADATVTFTAPKLCHALAPACDRMGELRVGQIGSPPSLYEAQVALITKEAIAPVFAARPRNSNKGSFGHVLIIAGSRGKSGAAAMAGLAALRSGAGLVTVACPESALSSIAAHAPELMTEPLPETASGTIAKSAFETIRHLAATRSVIAFGPGVGTEDETKEVAQRVYREIAKPAVFDADGLNNIAGLAPVALPALRVLTPHPGEMGRLAGRTTAEVQADRIATARAFATTHKLTLVLKGERSLIALEDGNVWINATGSPALATGGTGDILTGMTAAMLGQQPEDAHRAVAAAVYLHGLAGEIAARNLSEQGVIATDLLRFLPEGIRAIQNVSHRD